MSRLEITQRSQRLNPGFPGWEREAVKPSEVCTVAELESGTFSFMVQHVAPIDMHLILGGEFKTPLARFSRHWVVPVYFFQKKKTFQCFQEVCRSCSEAHQGSIALMPPALSQGNCVQIRGHVENCPQPYLPVWPFMTASPSVSPTSTAAQQGHIWAGSEDQDRPTATTAAEESPEDQGARRAVPHR